MQGTNRLNLCTKRLGTRCSALVVRRGALLPLFLSKVKGRPMDRTWSESSPVSLHMRCFFPKVSMGTNKFSEKLDKIPEDNPPCHGLSQHPHLFMLKKSVWALSVYGKYVARAQDVLCFSVNTPTKPSTYPNVRFLNTERGCSSKKVPIWIISLTRPWWRDLKKSQDWIFCQSYFILRF